MLTPHGYTFNITARGQKWSGTWMEEGKEVCVSSAFGSKRAPRRGKPAADVAAKTLRDLVNEWSNRR